MERDCTASVVPFRRRPFAVIVAPEILEEETDGLDPRSAISRKAASMTTAADAMIAIRVLRRRAPLSTGGVERNPGEPEGVSVPVVTSTGAIDMIGTLPP